MRDQLKNEFLLLLSTKLSSEDLRILSTALDLILSNYEVEPRNTELIPYGSDIPKTVEIYIVSKKIEGLSDKSLYLYKIVLEDFFRTVRKLPEKITANDIRIFLYQYQKAHGISNRTLDSKRTIICSYFGWMA